MSGPAREATTRRRLVVLTTTELAPGYRLAGVATLAAGTGPEAAELLSELVDGGEQGIIAVYEPFLRELEPRWRRTLEESMEPIVVALPAGEARVGASERRERLMRLLRQTVGYQITFEPGERQ